MSHVAQDECVSLSPCIAAHMVKRTPMKQQLSWIDEVKTQKSISIIINRISLLNSSSKTATMSKPISQKEYLSLFWYFVTVICD